MKKKILYLLFSRISSQISIRYNPKYCSMRILDNLNPQSPGSGSGLNFTGSRQVFWIWGVNVTSFTGQDLERQIRILITIIYVFTLVVEAKDEGIEFCCPSSQPRDQQPETSLSVTYNNLRGAMHTTFFLPWKTRNI